jgi:hypothetical protein
MSTRTTNDSDDEDYVVTQDPNYATLTAEDAEDTKAGINVPLISSVSTKRKRIGNESIQAAVAGIKRRKRAALTKQNVADDWAEMNKTIGITTNTSTSTSTGTGTDTGRA